MLPNATAKAECNVPVFAHRILSAVSENACHSFVWAPGRRFLAETKPARRCIITKATAVAGVVSALAVV